LLHQSAKIVVVLKKMGTKRLEGNIFEQEADSLKKLSLKQYLAG